MAEKVEIQISAGAFLLLAAIFMLLPLQWVVALFIAVMVHECFHFMAICLSRGKIRRIFIGATGMVMETDPLSGVQDIICAIAGPIGSFLLLLLIRWLPSVAICGLVQGIYNLLPLFPLDGGRILKGILFAVFSPQKAKTAFSWSQNALRLIIFIGCILLSFRVGCIPLVLALLLLRRQRKENLLAKKPFWRYNRSNIDKGVRL